MKCFNYLSPRYAGRLGILAAIILSILMLNACNTDEKTSSLTPKDDPDALAFRSPIEGLADSIFNNEHFQAILENQVWVNARVDEFMETADPNSSSAAAETISSWVNAEYELTSQDVELAKEVLGFPDDGSFQSFAHEMAYGQEELLNSFSASLSSLNEEERKALSEALYSLIPGSITEGRPIVGGNPMEIEFRRADCCCLRPNSCSWNVCTQLSNCLSNAGQFYFTTIFGVTGTGAAIGSSIAGVGGLVGAAFGFSTSAVFGAVYYGYSANRCHQTANEGCDYCDC